MKNIFLILIGAMLLVSCEKGTKAENSPVKEEEATGKAVDNFTFFHVGVVGGASTEVGVPGAAENLKGVAFEVDVKKLKLNGGVTKSCWTAFNYRVFVDGIWRRRWVQWGYFVDRFGLDRGFFVYDRTFSDGVVSPPIEYVNRDEQPQAGNIARFEIKNIEGSTWWAISINNIVLFNADLGTEVGSNFPPEAGSLNNTEIFTEARGTSTYNDVLEVYTMEVFKDGQWVKIPQARTSGQGWNIEGLGIAHFKIGGRGGVPSGTTVW